MKDYLKLDFVVLFGTILITGGALQLGCSSDDSEDSTDENDTDSDTTETDTEWEYECEGFVVDASISTAIGSVGIIEWSLESVTPESATIEFGVDENYGMQAPVDLSEAGYRTLLLGMKPSTEYHFKIVVEAGGDTTESCDCTLTTGPAPNGIPTHTVSTSDASAKEGGFTLSTIFMECDTFILDDDGDYVWWYMPNMQQCCGVRMSYDGKYMLIRNTNVGGPGGGGSTPSDGEIVKVSMDGLESETISLPNSHHDFTVLPDDTIAFIEYDGVDCDDIVERSSSGSLTTIFHLSDHITPASMAGSDGCHSNAIHYWPEDDTYTVSVLNTNQFVKFTRSGQLVWILGGPENDFSGNVSWDKQHGHHMYDGKLLFFNNGDMGQSATARVFSLDESNFTATQDWSYSSGNSSQTMGDTQHLDGGNTLVTFSNDGVIHEVDSSGNLVESISFSLGGGLGYAMRRPTLYGPPPR